MRKSKVNGDKRDTDTIEIFGMGNQAYKSWQLQDILKAKMQGVT